MRIKSFKFDDHRADWHLEETQFDAFNLLVGVSGVGKTKILDALRRVCRIATGENHNLSPVSWAITFEQGEQTYRWEGRSDVTRRASSQDVTASAELTDEPSEIVQEKIVVNGDKVLVDREGDRFTFDGASIPSLNKTVSAIFLLTDDEKVVPIHRAFRPILVSNSNMVPPMFLDPRHIFAINAATDRLRLSSRRDLSFEKFKEEALEKGLSAVANAPVVFAYYLQEAFPEEFARLSALFIGTFPSVKSLRVSWSGGRGKGQLLEFMIQEGDPGVWIHQSDMSSGMLRMLIHLVEISVAPPGSVVIIDEFENSLGVNCMPQLTDFILSRAPDLQFILTSHHPYVINKIPPETWKLVTRKGGHVRVISAKDIPSLQGVSHQKAFIRLINLPEFEEGIS